MRRLDSIGLAFAATAFLTPASLRAQNVLFYEDFESGIGNWQATGLWHAQSASQACSATHVPFPSGTSCAWFGSTSTCDFNAGGWNGSLTLTTAVPLPATGIAIALRFRSYSEGEDDGKWDLRRTWISDGGPNWTQLGFTYSNEYLFGSPAVENRWITQTHDLTPWAGSSVRLRFEFWAGDHFANNFDGWFLDDVVIEELSTPGIPYCFGDGTYGECPCDNYGAPGRGCASSFDPSGANMVTSGVASLSADTLLLSASGAGQGSVFFSQGDEQGLFGVGLIFGDGLKCAAGATIRLGNMIAVGGQAHYPNTGDEVVSVRGSVGFPGTKRIYQARYRNATPFCTEATFNTTNAVLVTWAP